MDLKVATRTLKKGVASPRQINQNLDKPDFIVNGTSFTELQIPKKCKDPLSLKISGTNRKETQKCFCEQEAVNRRKTIVSRRIEVHAN